MRNLFIGTLKSSAETLDKVEVFEYLICKKGFDLKDDLKDIFHIAKKFNSKKVLKFLLNHYCDISGELNTGYLHIESVENVKKILSNKLMTKEQLLAEAICYRQFEEFKNRDNVIKYLISQGANISSSLFGNYILNRNSNKEMIQYLVDHGAVIEREEHIWNADLSIEYIKILNSSNKMNKEVNTFLFNKYLYSFANREGFIDFMQDKIDKNKIYSLSFLGLDDLYEIVTLFKEYNIKFNYSMDTMKLNKEDYKSYKLDFVEQFCAHTQSLYKLRKKIHRNEKLSKSNLDVSYGLDIKDFQKIEDLITDYSEVFQRALWHDNIDLAIYLLKNKEIDFNRISDYLCARVGVDFLEILLKCENANLEKWGFLKESD